MAALPAIPAENIEQLMPPGYTVARDEIDSTKARVGVTAVRCERLELGPATARDVTWAVFSVALAPTELVATPADYRFWHISDSAGLIELLRRAGGAGSTATYVPELVFQVAPDPDHRGLHRFIIDAPPPTPSPFVAWGTAEDVPTRVPAFRIDHLTDAPGARMRIASTIDVLALGRTHGTLRPQAGSQLEAVLCSADEGGSAFDNVHDPAGFVRFEGGFTLEASRPEGYEYEPRHATCPPPIT